VNCWVSHYADPLLVNTGLNLRTVVVASLCDDILCIFYLKIHCVTSLVGIAVPVLVLLC
jgi:hypothetical protein